MLRNENLRWAAGISAVLLAVFLLMLPADSKRIAQASGVTHSVWSHWPETASDPATVRKVVALGEDAQPSENESLRMVALQAEDPLVVGNAIRGLVDIEAFADDPALLELLEDPRPRVKQEAVMAVGHTGRQDLVPLVVQRLDDPVPGVRPLAIQALGRLGGAESEEVLSRLDEDQTLTDIDRAFVHAALESIENHREPAELDD